MARKGDGGKKMKTKTEWNQRRETGVGEECGVFGIYDIDGKM